MIPPGLVRARQRALIRQVAATKQSSYQQNLSSLLSPTPNAQKHTERRTSDRRLRESARERYDRCMSGRGFPSPWTVEDNDACFVVTDANGQTLGYFYFEEDYGRRSAAKLLTKDEARRIAVNFARLPELLRSQPHWR